MASDSVASPRGRSSARAAAAAATTAAEDPAAEEQQEVKVTKFYPEAVPARTRGRRQDAKGRAAIDEKDSPPTVLEALRNQWREKMERRERGEDTLGLRDTIQELSNENDSIQTVRKERVFDDEVTEEEMSIIQQRVALQQRRFQEYQRREVARKVDKVRSMFEFLKPEEIAEALADAKDDEDTTILNFTKPQYLTTLRKQMALKYQTAQQEVGLTEEQQQAYDRLMEKRKKAVKKTTAEDAKKRCIKYSRLRLDEALSQLEAGHDPSKVFEGWSDARVRAYQQIKTKPNSYYYRFNAPGEKQRNGVWTKEERTLFFKRLDEMGADGQWGIFSQTIPGRVGYQCSNFYRGLLKSGEIVDPNYLIDAKGELRYLFGKKDGGEGVIRHHSKHGSGGVKTQRTTSSSSTVKKRKRRNRNNDDSDDDDADDGNVDDLFDQDDSGNFTCKVSWATTRRTRARLEAAEADPNEGTENPLPGFTDPISLEEVVKPAISPFGHVMSYDSWIRCLGSEDRKNICPLTKKPLTKRELVVLTHENIEEYRDKIVNG